MRHSIRIFIVMSFLAIILFGCSSSPSSGTPSPAPSTANKEAVSDPLVRKTQFGIVQGHEDGQTYAWLGIPYAQPPVGDLRWRAPQDPTPWTGVRTTQGFCSACPQYGGLMGFMDPDTFGKPVGSEDCLYLNIWRPKSDARDLPVLFWIHGGGNFSGQANMTMYYGANFSGRENIIFVSINYRVGAIGWFTHPTLRGGDVLDASGNYGTLDLIKALAWVQNNIAAFGGDPSNVTIDGQSGGAQNVFSLLVSPLTEGLFQKAIAQSGGPGSTALADGDKVSSTVLDKLFELDQIPADDPRRKDAAAYLRSKPWQDIYACLTPSVAGMLGGGWSSIFEDGTVISDNIADRIDDGNFRHVPMIFGSTKDEAKIFLPLVVSKLKNGDVPVEVAFHELIMDFDPDNPNFALSDVLSPLWLLLYDPLADFTDSLAQKMSTDSLARKLADQQENIYVYEFAWDEEPAPLDTLVGAGHAIEIPFAFSNFGRTADDLFRFAWSSANLPGRLKLSDVMSEYWAQFARTGDPNTPGSYPWPAWSNKPKGFKKIILDSELNSLPEPTPPGQPAKGLGSAARYICENFSTVKLAQPDGTAVWYYVPELLKKGDKAPVMIVLHGFSQTDPSISMGQIRHYVRQGCIVVFPQFGLTGLDIFQDLDQSVMLARAITLTNLALSELGVKADRSDVLIVGHSLGGLLALCWEADGGIRPRRMILQNPSVTNQNVPAFVRDRMTMLDFETKGQEVKCPVILLSADADTIAPISDTTAAYESLTNAPSKVLYMVHSDYHGKPGLTADHCAPLLIGCSIVPGSGECLLSEENAFDFRVYYAATDAMLDGQNNVAFDMGFWSDGIPVKDVETIMQD
jgi:para-nitrobenzyl esterase